jgi:hypothetical protein
MNGTGKKWKRSPLKADTLLQVYVTRLAGLV